MEARNIHGKELSIWVGARLYRGPDVHIADHFFFNDHSGQGFGIEYKKSTQRITLEESLMYLKDPSEEFLKLAKLNAAVILFLSNKVDSIEEAYTLL